MTKPEMHIYHNILLKNRLDAIMLELKMKLDPNTSKAEFKTIFSSVVRMHAH